MPSNQFHYLPLAPAFFSLLVGVLVVVVVLIQLGILRHAYIRLGVGARPALVLLFGSLIGSYINIPIAALPAEQLMSGRDVIYFGMHYVVPVVVDWPGTVIAINVDVHLSAGQEPIVGRGPCRRRPRHRGVPPVGRSGAGHRHRVAGDRKSVV